MSLQFDLDLDAEPGRVDTVGPDIRRVLAPNPGPFTFKGTGTYIVGHGRVAVIDPGPADVTHIDALVGAFSNETVTHILVTHTHADHSPGARLLQARVGGLIVGCAPHPAGDDRLAEAEAPAAGDGKDEKDEKEPKESHDRSYTPDTELHDDDCVSGPGWTLEAIHTPGHIANHLCFAFREADVIFSGDHVMRWSTSVISPPAGDLRAYMDSRRQAGRPDRQVATPERGRPAGRPVRAWRRR